MSELEGLLNVDQAAELLGVPPSWVRRRANAGVIPSVRLGRYLRFDPVALRAWWSTAQTGDTTEQQA